MRNSFEFDFKKFDELKEQNLSSFQVLEPLTQHASQIAKLFEIAKPFIENA